MEGIISCKKEDTTESSLSVKDESKPNQKRKRHLSKKERKELKKKKKQEQKGTVSVDDAKTENKEDDYLASYQPVLEVQDSNNKGKNKTLGKWFPTAKVIKASSGSDNTTTNTNTTALLLFYQYAEPLWDQDKADLLVKNLLVIGKARGLGGRLRVAREGVNATVSALTPEPLRHLAQDLRNFCAKTFSKTEFKYVDGLPADRHFKDLKVYPVQEIVYYGISPFEAPLDKGGVHLEPEDYHEKMKEGNTVIIDVRNHYEAAIGRFDGQQLQTGENKCGATYIDPLMRRSTDFPTWLAQPETQEILEGKQVLMYCTGGVRCERASSYLNSKMGDKVNGVYQLQGGIEKYFKKFPDGGFWRGKNFVFDKREAVGVEDVAGDGGVVRKKDKKGKKDLEEMKCCVCNKPWDRYIGKKRCYPCGVPVLLCDACLSKKVEHKNILCPLCKQDVAVGKKPAELSLKKGTPHVNGGGAAVDEFVG